MFVLECIHPALILPLILPGIYMCLKIREDRLLIWMAAAGFSVVICSVVCKAAVRRVRTLSLYLLASLGGILLSLLTAWQVSAGMTAYITPHAQILRKVLLAVTALECLLTAGDAFHARMREDSRRKAILNNDIEWAETAGLLEKPALWFLLLFVLLYMGARWTACPVMCSLALGAGILYMLLALLYGYLEGTEMCLNDVKELSHVPAGKVRKIGLGMALLILMLLAGMGGISVLLSPFRTYHDIRQWEPKVTLTEQEIEQFYAPMESVHFPMEAFLDEEADQSPPRPVPVWVKAALWILAAVIAVLILRGLFSAIRRIFIGFREGLEENGDIAESLYEDETEKTVSSSLRNRQNLVKNRIRRNYIRTIRRYRKTTPSAHETPAEIEAQAAFPERIDKETLHRTYEQTRYGP